MESKEIKLTPEQERLLEVTAKWLFESYSMSPERYADLWPKKLWFDLAVSLLKVQQAAGAVLKDSNQKLPANRYSGAKIGNFYQCWKNAQEDTLKAGFVKVQPLTGGKE